MTAWNLVGRYEWILDMLVFGFFACRIFPRKNHWTWRALIGILVCFLGGILTIENTTTMWMSIPFILILFLLTIWTLVFCYEETLDKILFVSVVDYICQIVLYSVFIILQTILPIKNSWQMIALYAALLAAALILMNRFLVKKIRADQDSQVHPVLLLLVFGTAFLLDTVFKFYLVDNHLGHETGGIFIAWKSFSMVSCLLLLMILMGNLKKNHLSAEKQKLEELLYQRQQQYELTRENMELINIKCHDLKHWFERVQKMSGKEYEKEAGEIKEALVIYDSVYHTGNETLDTILTEKQLYCEYNKIHLTCMADGKKLDFLTISEICSIFGNLVDNAIEAAAGVKEEEKRTINLTVKTWGDFLSIHEENYYEGKRKRLGENFETSKKDKVHHGFGLKSIRMVTEKHGGEMTIQAEDGVFNLNILIPFPTDL